MRRRDFLRSSALTVPVLRIPGLWKRALGVSVSPDSQTPLQVNVDTSASGRAIDRYWTRCVGAGRANEGLRANWLEQLKLCVDQCGFQYLRFHGLFHDDMFVYREQNSQPVYNWQYIDELFDRMLAIGIRPFVELTFFPKDIAHDEGTFAWWRGHGTPPKDFTRWAEIISNFIKHCQSRYGKDEVRKWYFEAWNEPNLEGFWNGTQQQFFEMYKAVATAIKKIDPQLRVGGPSTSSFHPDEAVYQQLARKKDISAKDYIGVESKGPWIVDFLAYCEKENLAVDFVASHPYPTSYPIDSAGNHLEVSRPVSSTKEDILWLRKAMSKTRYANAEIHLTEWSSSPSISDYAHDFPQEAAYIVKVNLDCIGLAQSLSYWTFTDVFEEAGGAPTVFSGGFGLVNFQGIVKPSFHAYRMLNLLGDEELHREEGCIVTKNRNTGQVSALLYNYPLEVLASPPLSKNNPKIAEETLAMGSSRIAQLHFRGLKPHLSYVVETVDAQHGFAYRDWQAMGSPEPPTREQTAELRKKAIATKKVEIKVDASGELHWSVELPAWAVVAIYPG
jgi:xylan 1,4-beta-xylosidase